MAPRGQAESGTSSVMEAKRGGAARLAVVTSHPVQYHTPWYRALAAAPDIDLEVLYCHRATPAEQASAGFGVEFDWDTDLLQGYRHRFLRSAAKAPSLHRFSGLDNPELAGVLAEGRYDAVMVSGWHYKSVWQAMWACLRRGIPVMARSDSHLHSPRHRFRALVKEPPYRWFIPKLAACLAVGRWSAEYFIHYGAHPGSVFHVPHSIDSSFETTARALAPSRNEIRRAWGLRPEHKVFLFAGKFTHKKRPCDFVNAVRAASTQARVAGLMAGDGPLRPECERRSADAPVRFAGFLNQSEIVRAYAAADVLVLPSDGNETWGLVVNEAMACGLPCIVSDRAGCGPDLVQPGETGFVFPVGDVEQLAKRMVDCAADPGGIKVMGENARRMLSGYSIEAAVEGLRQAIAKVTRRT